MKLLSLHSHAHQYKQETQVKVVGSCHLSMLKILNADISEMLIFGCGDVVLQDELEYVIY